MKIIWEKIHGNDILVFDKKSKGSPHKDWELEKETKVNLEFCIDENLKMMFHSFICMFSDYTQLSTAVAWREKKSKRFVFNKYFCLVLGVL